MQREGPLAHKLQEAMNLGVSLVCMVVYGIRLWIGKGVSVKVVNLMGLVLVMCNVVVMVWLETLLLDTRLEYHTVAKEIHGDPYVVGFDHELFWKDMKMMGVVSATFMAFTVMTRKMGLILRQQDQQDDIEKNLVTGSSDMPNKTFQKALKVVAKFAAICMVMVVVLPSHLMLRSSLTIYDSFKIDHVYWTINIMFLSCMVTNLVGVWERVKVNKILLSITVFWVYNVIVLMVSTGLLVIFNDTLISIYLIMRDVSRNEYQYDYNISIFTSLLLRVLNHNQCVNGCSTAEKVQLMASLFASSKQYFQHCLEVLFSCGLVVFPMTIRLLCISCRKHIPK